MFADEQVRAASAAMVRKLDDSISDILHEIWKSPWTMDDVKRRCKLVRIYGEPFETLLVDDVPRLEIWPIEMEQIRTDSGWTMRLEQNFRRVSTPVPLPERTAFAEQQE